MKRTFFKKHFSNAKVLLFIYQLSHSCNHLFSTGSDVSLIVVTQIQLWWLSVLLP